MTWISDDNWIYSKTVHYITKDEEKEIRDTTQYIAENIAQGRHLYKKQYLPYRLVNGIPLPGKNRRLNDDLMDSGLCLLDFDFKDSKDNHYLKVLLSAKHDESV